MIVSALRRVAAPRIAVGAAPGATVTEPVAIPELTRPEGVRPPVYDAIVKNPAWPMDTTGVYRPDGEMPPEAIWMAGTRPSVIMIRAGDVEDAELLPQARGEVRIGRGARWQAVPPGWRFVTAEWAFRDLAERLGETRPAGRLLVDMTIEEFIRTVSAGRDRVGVDQISPYEFGTDLRLDEYRAEQQQLADDDRERPKGVSPITLAVLGGILVAMLIFAPQPQIPQAPVGPEAGVQTARVEAGP